MKQLNERNGLALLAGVLIALILWPALTASLHAAGVLLAALPGLGVAFLVRRRLPSRLDGVVRRHPVVSTLWMVLALLTVVQTARLGDFMAHEESDWWLTTQQEFWSKHMCMAAYFYAADLDRQGVSNVYDATHYPGLNPEAVDRSTVANLTPDDPYQYPPQFLLLPRLAVTLSNDFQVVKPWWYAAQALLFLGVAVWLAVSIGGRAGEISMWLLPALWISVPFMLNFQYGQFHLTALALAAAAFLAFEKGRSALGGGMLAAAILAKGFPGIVVIPLLLQRRWRSLAWTGAWSVAFTALTAIILGTDVFTAFFQHHLPRVQSGEAFAFHEVWTDFMAPLLAGNISVYSLVLKLDQLGVPGMTGAVARALHGGFSMSVLIGAFWIAGSGRNSRQARAISWFALINLASMTSPAAWGDYVPVGTLWLLPLLAGTNKGGFSDRWLWAMGGLCFLLPGVVPVGNWPGPVLGYVLSIATTLALIGFNGLVVLRGRVFEKKAVHAPAVPAPA